MMNSLYSAATGMSAQQMSMDVIAHNLSNVNTTGFKSSRLTFDDLLYQFVGSRQDSREGVQVGMGVAPGRTQVVFSQGQLTETGVNTNIAIEGDGFLQVQVGDQIAFTRDGNLGLDANGQLVTSQGYRLVPPIVVPASVDANSLKIGSNGRVTGNMGGTNVLLGQINVATFGNPAGLAPQGENLWRATVNSGVPTVTVPGQNGAGMLRQGYTEASNVSVMEEMVNMISAQRAFESVAKVLSTSDEMLGIANSIRR